MGFDKGNKKKKCIIAGVITALLVIMVVSVAVITNQHARTCNHKKADANIKMTSKAVEAVCAPTDFKETCVNSFMKASPNATEPLDLIKLSFNITIQSIKDGIKKSSVELKAKADDETKGSLELCETVMNDAIDDLTKCFDNFAGFSVDQIEKFVDDLRVWLSGSISYQQTCMDAFEEVKSTLAEDMKNIFKPSKELTSNSLAMITSMSSMFGKSNITEATGDLGNNSRKLLSAEDGIPSWVGPDSRRLMAAPLGGVKPNVVVAKDGSGQYKSINEALKAVPNNNKVPFVIYIKEGVYKEKVIVTKQMFYVTFIGDGPTKTKITGNLNFAIGKVRTYLTSSLTVEGDNFLAKNIGIENTAGPQGGQAVALRVSADQVVIFNCQIDGYQDTLYAHAHRQFYRDSTISGTVDFIFGDSVTVFQNCIIVVRKPMGGQGCMVTAQGRSDKREPTAIVLHNCRIIGEPAYIPVKHINKAYLGRPWKEFARTIVMRTTITDVIDPAGWSAWNGDFALKTLFYAEYENSGPGSNKAQRVKWPGIQRITRPQALGFAPARFLGGRSWIPQTGVPYLPNLQ
ncbi:probable pectinesterase/pectinesterase inhibitor 58 [Raphanus sativus]|uniref:Pectinesterase n=1 Tax=Raphanus sativus TaxID=3726 RepID=A0A6J0JX57_RAPSA|nr:probable pectinesterase/pectinesterase inhibitor 58 [Raphanus sativus]